QLCGSHWSGPSLYFPRTAGASEPGGRGGLEARPGKPRGAGTGPSNPPAPLGSKEGTLRLRRFRSLVTFAALLIGAEGGLPAAMAQTRPRVVEIRLDMMIHHVSAEFVMRGIKSANDSH